MNIMNITDHRKNERILEYIEETDLSNNEDAIDLLINKYDIPYISSETKGIKAIDFERVNDYCKNGYFLFEDVKGSMGFAVNNLSIVQEQGFSSSFSAEIFLIKKSHLYSILERDFAFVNTINAKDSLAKIDPKSSAKSIDYPKTLMGFLTLFLATIIFAVNQFSLLNIILYFVQNLLKAVLFGRNIVQQVKQARNGSSSTLAMEKLQLTSSDPNLPIYSVLVPLYKEEIKASSILRAIAKLNYPKSKLDVKFIIEADDHMTIRALAGLSIPSYVHVIKVPYSLPRTKPKALNYAMSFVLGEYLTIYDAEDEPDQDQLLKAITTFRGLAEDYICLQSKLNFYNANDNLLTRLFSIEYSIWFDYMLQGLSLFGLPITLGGTSNHFKVDKLREIGLWDAYNVTEDADLGIRIYLKGYKVSMLDSTTMEEAPNNLVNWMGQRARWIKGFIQTTYVFVQAKKDYSKLGLLKIATVYIFVGLSTYSFFFLPWLLMLLLLDLNPLISDLWMVNSFFSISYMYSVAYIVASRKTSLVTMNSLLDIMTIICWPLYFFLHTIASYRAIWEIITVPFKWNKTPHGIDTIDEM